MSMLMDKKNQGLLKLLERALNSIFQLFLKKEEDKKALLILELYIWESEESIQHS